MNYCEHCKGTHRYAYQARNCAIEARGRSMPIGTSVHRKLEEYSMGEYNPQRNREKNSQLVVGKRKSMTQKFGAAVSNKGGPLEPTKNQLEYIASLAEKKGVSGLKSPQTRAQASELIGWLKSQPDMANSEPGPIISYHATNIIPRGYYAVRVDEEHAYVFFRVSIGKFGAHKGNLMVHTKHSDGYVKRLEFTPEGKTLVQNNRLIEKQKLAELITAIIIDQTGTALAYADKLGNCSRCNKDLTNGRSRHYGIGPECEKHWKTWVNEIDEIKGPYRGE